MSAEILELNIKNHSVPVVYEHSRYLPLVSIQLVFRDSGVLASRVSGLPKLASSLLGEGNASMGSVAFSTALESRAVSINASVGDETFVISLHSLKSEFAFGLEMLTQLLSDPNYTPEAFDKVQKLAIGRATQKQGDLDFVAGAKLKSILFANSSKEYPSGGTVETLSSIELADIQRYIESHIGLDNLIVVIGGDIESSEALSILRPVLDTLGSVDVPALEKITTLNTPRVETTYLSTEQAYVYFGAPYDLPYNSSEKYLGKVASFVLGSSGFGSRLMEEIRVKRGLAYSAHSSLNLNRTSGYLWGHLQTKLESMDKAKDVVQKVVNEFVESGITIDELEAAKSFLLGSEPLRNETLQQRVGRAFGEYYSDGKLGAKQVELENIASLDLDKINNFIKQHSEIAKLSFSVVTDRE